MKDGKKLFILLLIALIAVSINFIRKNCRNSLLKEYKAAKSNYEKMKENIMEELRKTFRPEFLNRIDEVIVFHPLEQEHIYQIVDLMVKDLEKKMAALNVHIEVTEAAKKFLGEKGFDQEYGARPLKRTITRMIEDKLSEEILKGTISKDDAIVADVEDGKIVLKKRSAIS